MRNVLFTLPLPSSGGGHFFFEKKLGRTCVLICTWDDLPSQQLILEFNGVEAFKCTYHLACSLEQIQAAYDKVVDMGISGWLQEITGGRLARYGEAAGLRHLIIYFDDGPCYEFICREFVPKTLLQNEDDNTL